MKSLLKFSEANLWIDWQTATASELTVVKSLAGPRPPQCSTLTRLHSVDSGLGFNGFKTTWAKED